MSISQASSLTWSTDLGKYDIPIEVLLSQYPTQGQKLYLAAGAVVFGAADKVLLIQRSFGDSRPGLWETPGGGCDLEDQSVLHAAARELLEESGLTATKVTHIVGKPDYFTSTSGKRIMKLDFIVEVGPGAEERVKLDPKEHQDHVWATEDEVQAGAAEDRTLSWTSPEQRRVVLEAFRLRRR